MGQNHETEAARRMKAVNEVDSLEDGIVITMVKNSGGD
jgi:hypothetical protein